MRMPVLTATESFFARLSGRTSRDSRSHGDSDEAAQVLEEALQLHEQKGDLVSAERTRALLVQLGHQPFPPSARNLAGSRRTQVKRECCESIDLLQGEKARLVCNVDSRGE